MAYEQTVPYNVPLKLLVPEWKTVNGVRKKQYPDPGSVGNDMLFFGSFRTFGGTETEHNGVYGIENTAVIETWYRPDIKADCAVALADTGEVYEIMGEPENIERRNKLIKMKVRRIGGGA